MQASSGDFTEVEMNAIERTLNNSFSERLALKRDQQKLNSMFSKKFQFRLNFIGTNPQFAEIFRYYITEAQIIQNWGFRSTLKWLFCQNVIQLQPQGSKSPIVLYQEM